jgi:hypothetical protein
MRNFVSLNGEPCTRLDGSGNDAFPEFLVTFLSFFRHIVWGVPYSGSVLDRAISSSSLSVAPSQLSRVHFQLPRLLLALSVLGRTRSVYVRFSGLTWVD